MARVTATASARAWPFRRVELPTFLMTVLLVIVGVLVLLPLVQTVLQSFQLSRPGEPVIWGLDGWRVVFTDSPLKRATWNTISLAVVRQAIALVAAVFIAWLLARTDVPGSKIFEFIFWLAFFLPSLTVTLTWILMLDPQFGMFNQALKLIGIGPLNIYSFWGIVWVHLMGTSLAIMVMVLTPTFRNMNSALEDASRVAGASLPGTLVRVFVPLMLPAIVAIEFLAFLRSLEAFEIEQILGTPIGLYVFSTWIYDALNQTAPRYNVVSALAVLMIVLATGLIFLQRWLIGSRQYTTVTGQFQGQVLRLGRLRWMAFAFLVVLSFLIVGVPLIFSVMGTFMKLFGFLFIEQPWTLKHWQTALSDRLLVRALQNTLTLGLGTAFVAITLNSVIAYVIVRTRYFARGTLDFVTWLPFTVPGIILSLALLTMFLLPVFRPLYGTMVTLVLALVISGMPFTVQVLKGNLVQLGMELEEASWVSGSSWWHTYRRVVLPLISPMLVVTGVISFISAARNISQVALLSNTAIRPLSMTQLEYISQGKFEVAAVIATLLLFVSLALALVARVFGYRGV